ncbi:hypothetical protein FRX31_033843 [Thalictrum thalictroides]|uniref:Uncharacterized protein n=1 Tax=Thalictrum thalictroides TaxID=46969 RepID=A0A7J6UWK3_THATH|nr:hypothetical protein FRX31_033843 [Thalictrum thalictroides]
MIRNFLWSGNPTSSKEVSISWEKCCKPLEEGGLGFGRLKEINLALLMILAWHIMSEHDDFANFMSRKYFIRDGELIDYYVKSSIWSVIKWAYLEDGLTLDSQAMVGCRATVNSIIHNNSWNVPVQVQSLFTRTNMYIFDIPALASSEEDKLMWILDSAVKAFESMKLPWWMKRRWTSCRQKLLSCP